jgi:hypothetical protein
VLDDGKQFDDKEFADAILNKKADDLFLELLALFTKQRQTVSHKKEASTFAPAKMEDHTKAKTAKVNKTDLANAMQRLLDGKRIHVVLEGEGTARVRSHLAVGPPDSGSEDEGTADEEAQ